jgi:hypothetical protein
MELLVAIGIIATGIPVYLLFIKCQLPDCLYKIWSMSFLHNSSCFINRPLFSVSLTRLVQKICLCVPDETYVQ